jgi:hypothetical protein
MPDADPFEVSTNPLTFVPTQRGADDEPSAPRQAVTTPHDVTQISRDDAVMLPRHIADAAYHVLQAIHALKDNGSHELFDALGKALDKGRHRALPVVPPPCEVCHIDVSNGLQHHSECWSDDAVSHRTMAMAIPGLQPEE